MVELVAKSACSGMAPFEVKGCRLQEVEYDIMHLLLPYSGKIKVLSDTMKLTHGVGVDQSDSWAVVRLQGDLAAEVLSRLTPLDLRPSVFKRGHTARSSLQHMNVSISCVGAQAFEIMAFRSMAQTLVDDLKTAMLSMAAQR